MSLKNSDDNSFENIYNQHITPIYRYVYSRVKHKQEAEDLTHNIFIKALEAERDGRANITLRYLFTIARRTVIDFWRKKKNLNLSDPEEIFNKLVDDKTDINKEIISQEGIAEARKIIETLKDNQKDVIIMRFVNDLSTKEIAKIMNKTEMAVRKIQSRALKNIRTARGLINY